MNGDELAAVAERSLQRIGKHRSNLMERPIALSKYDVLIGHVADFPTLSFQEEHRLPHNIQHLERVATIHTRGHDVQSKSSSSPRLHVYGSVELIVLSMRNEAG
jgi:hypothetical protein